MHLIFAGEFYVPQISCLLIDTKSGENKIIYDEITALANAIVYRIGEIDEQFKGTVIPSGSVSDGCKIGYPNEFDYIVESPYFKDCIETFIPGQVGFMALGTTNEQNKNIAELRFK